MYSLLLICGVVAIASAHHRNASELLFKQYNKCGCFDMKNCPTRYKPNCTTEYFNYDELYHQNSVTSKSPELCSDWFLEGFKKQLNGTHIVSENGTLKILVFFSLKSYQETDMLGVELRYQKQCLDVGNSSSFEMLEERHSIKYVKVEESYNDSCKKAVEISFPYVFSGCYQLYINSEENKAISGGCMSRPFNVTSPYKKSPINNFKMQHYANYMAQNGNLISRSIGEGLKEPKSIHVKLIKNCPGKDGVLVKEAHLTSVEKGGCCDTLDHPGDVQPLHMTYCPCKWETDRILKCEFREVKHGNYCIVVEFIDPRCDNDSLWKYNKALNKTLPCNWSALEVAKGKITPTDTEPYKVNNLFSMIILFCAIVVLFTAAIVFTLHYLQKEKGKKRTLAVENIVEKSLFISEEEEILLLYPRDCDRFMNAMALFRILLKESCGCKVHDAWDEEIYDKVAESIETWSLPLIQNKNTKIIVVLSECSKVIEESYIGSNNFATYREPKAFDKVFAQSIKALNEYFATRNDSYRRVFVVRFDEIPVIDFSFHFNRATVYILPHALQTLVDDLQNGNSTPLNKESVLQLKAAIHEYQVYKKQYTNYLNDILNINNNCKITICLKNGMMR